MTLLKPTCTAAVFIGITILLRTPSEAAVFTAQVVGRDCAGVDSDDTAASVSCSYAAAYSGPGALGAVALSNSSRNSMGQLSTTGEYRAGATYRDTIFFGVDEGYFSIPVSFTGNISLSAYFNDAFGVHSAYGSADVNGALFSYSVRLEKGIGPATSIHTGTESEIKEVRTRFSGGQMSLVASLGAGAYCGDVFRDAWCRASSDYSSTLAFLGGTVLDNNGDPISGVSVRSDSGFDYLKGYGIPSVPLPAGLPLALAAVFCLALVKAAARASN